jgi:medium-chain acyl-[acyl-carrier-protein] hydrolase
MAVRRAPEGKDWVRVPAASAAGRPRLFCFPSAGAGVAMFNGWDEALPAVDVCPVRLPGRENLLLAPPHSDIEPLVAAVAEALAPFLDARFVLYGHSMGAFVAFELARLLRREGRRQPEALVVSAQRGPQMPLRGEPMSLLPDDEFVAELARFDGTPGEVFEAKELLALLLPTLRADLAVTDTYAYRPEPPLDLPIAVFGGADDALVEHEELAAWRDETARESTLELLPGGRFFIHDPGSGFLRKLGETLARFGVTQASPARAS